MWILDLFNRASKRKAEEEAKRKAEEAKRKAEEAKRKAEEEAKRKAEEAKRKAEEEAKSKAEEAKRKAEEAKRKAEEEAKSKERKYEIECETEYNSIEDAFASLAKSLQDDPIHKIRSKSYRVFVYSKDQNSLSRQIKEFEDNGLLLSVKKRLIPARPMAGIIETADEMDRLRFPVSPTILIEDLNGIEKFKWEGFVSTTKVNQYIESNQLIHSSSEEKDLFTESDSISLIKHCNNKAITSSPQLNKVKRVQLQPNRFLWGIYNDDNSIHAQASNEQRTFVSYTLCEDWNHGDFVFLTYDSSYNPLILDEERMALLNKAESVKSYSFYEDYLYIGENEFTEKQGGIRSRYAVVITNYGMFMGDFPAGFNMKRCIGHFYDLNGNVYNGTWTLPINGKKWTNKEGDFLLG